METKEISSNIKNIIVKYTFWGTVIAAIIGGIGAVVSSYISILTRLPAKEYIYRTKVFADKFPFASTDITVEEGDEIWIIVEGDDASWDCTGSKHTSPDGYFDDKRNGFYNPSANFCELVGNIQENSVSLRIGTFENFIAQTSGLLYLGANDDPTEDNNKIHSYYLDNKGQLSIKIIVKKK